MTGTNRNLAVRVMTALVLLPGVLYLLWLGGAPFALLVAAAAALCAWELNQLPSQAPEPPAQMRGLGGVIASVGAAFLLPLTEGVEIPGFTTKAILSVLVVVAFADALLFDPEPSRAPQRVGLAVLGAVYPGVLMSALVHLRRLPEGLAWLILTLVVTWLNDTGAYFVGRALGRRKLYPSISPSKTWEGAAGGLVASVAGGLGARAFFGPSTLPWWGAAAVGVGAGVVGPLGDLSESMLKRAYGAKDSSRLLPGHGGLLDRIDALLFTAPFVLFCARAFAGLR